MQSIMSKNQVINLCAEHRVGIEEFIYETPVVKICKSGSAWIVVTFDPAQYTSCLELGLVLDTASIPVTCSNDKNLLYALKHVNANRVVEWTEDQPAFYIPGCDTIQRRILVDGASAATFDLSPYIFSMEPLTLIRKGHPWFGEIRDELTRSKRLYALAGSAESSALDPLSEMDHIDEWLGLMNSVQYPPDGADEEFVGRYPLLYTCGYPDLFKLWGMVPNFVTAYFGESQDGRLLPFLAAHSMPIYAMLTGRRLQSQVAE